MFRGYSQHDANEFMLFFINEIMDDNVKCNENNGSNHNNQNIMKNAIKKICFGLYREYIVCNNCDQVTKKKSEYLDIILPIPDGDNIDVEDCFRLFGKSEKIESRVLCDHCKKNVTIRKRTEIEVVPDVMIITFKRFDNNRKNNKPIKLYSKIELENKKLKLIATINHYGGLYGGHYISHVNKNDIWFKLNDSQVSRLNDKDFENLLNDESIYMAIYEIDT
jgi:ubiquitin carboxyl-terminal hydrolase 36/42